jgi:hypothetical protein
MQVFSMHYDYHQTAKELDYKRLGKQRVESWQILGTIQKKKDGLTKAAWINHPCIKIWYNCELALVNYSIAICEEWIKRGYKDTMLDRFLNMKEVFEKQNYSSDLPSLYGVEKFHLSHQSNLLKKDFNYYSKLYDVPNDLPYYWGE